MKKFTIDNLKETINKQMEINGYTERYDDLKEINEWSIKFTTTEEKEEEYREYLREYLKKYIPKKRIDKEISWFILDYGLRVIR